MKAIIAGIQVDGTPEEIVKLHVLLKTKADSKKNIKVADEIKKDPYDKLQNYI